MDLSVPICVHIPTGTNSCYDATNNKVFHLHHYKYTIFNKKKITKALFIATVEVGNSILLLNYTIKKNSMKAYEGMQVWEHPTY